MILLQYYYEITTIHSHYMFTSRIFSKTAHVGKMCYNRINKKYNRYYIEYQFNNTIMGRGGYMSLMKPKLKGPLIIMEIEMLTDFQRSDHIWQKCLSFT